MKEYYKKEQTSNKFERDKTLSGERKENDASPEKAESWKRVTVDSTNKIVKRVTASSSTPSLENRRKEIRTQMILAYGTAKEKERQERKLLKISLSKKDKG